jgi:hypothetical protein
MIKAFFAIFLFISSLNLMAQAGPQKLLSFADSLADEGDYYRAITEYKRALHYFPAYEKKDFIQLEIGKLYFKGNRFRQAQNYLIPLTASDDSGLQQSAHGWLAMSYFYDRQYINSERLFTDLSLTQQKEGLIAKELKIMQAISLAGLKKFDESNSIFDELSGSFTLKSHQKFIQSAIKLTEEGTQLETRSPAWAAFWGTVIPGAGYLYNDDAATAFVAFLTVAATGYLSYDGFARDAPVQGGIFLAVATGFYGGSIYGGYRQSKKWNANLGKEQFSSLLKAHKRLTLSIQTSF